MVGRHLLYREEGISSVEFAIVCSVFFLFVLGIIDFSRALWEWNSAAKATHMGVRFAVVNDPVTDRTNYDGLANGYGNGQAIPIDQLAENLHIAARTLRQLQRLTDPLNERRKIGQERLAHEHHRLGGDDVSVRLSYVRMDR